jgi:hypothetical protein
MIRIDWLHEGDAHRLVALGTGIVGAVLRDAGCSAVFPMLHGESGYAQCYSFF